jgi:hypothetical protein
MNNINNSKILENALIGVEFEFYSNKSIDDTAKELASLLGKKIRVESKAHSDFEVTRDEFKIEPDMSGGEKLMELVTGAQPYHSGRMMIIKVCKWIEENGYTNDRSSIHLNLSFDTNKIENKHRISKMNVLKFILDFKESQVFKFFPERKDSAYAKSIKFILPKSDTYFFDGLNITPSNFTFPDSKYYGVNFEKRHKNYLEFRYLGGADWEKKTSKILQMLELFISQLWDSTSSTSFTPLNAIELRKILSKNEKIIKSRSNWRNIDKGWNGKVKLTVDLKDNEKIIDLHWPNIRERVLTLFTHGELNAGHINYDSDNGTIQVEGGNLPYCVDLRGYEFVRCFLRGEFTECDFFSCDVNGSDIHSSNFYQSSQVNSSKLESSYVHQTCVLKDCYIYGSGMMKGKMEGGIFRDGKYDKKTAQFSTETEKILYTEV